MFRAGRLRGLAKHLLSVSEGWGLPWPVTASSARCDGAGIDAADNDGHGATVAPTPCTRRSGGVTAEMCTIAEVGSRSDLPERRLGQCSDCRPYGQNSGERRGVRNGIRRQSVRRLSSNCIVSDKLLLPQTGVLSLGVLQSRDVAVGVLPQFKDVLITVPHKHSCA